VPTATQISTLVICQECKKEGKKSRVYVGGGMTTLMGVSSFYDEEGRYHMHDPNTTTTDFSCSNGHRWTESRRNPCWCEEGKV
jgi:hypothetical protein